MVPRGRWLLAMVAGIAISGVFLLPADGAGTPEQKPGKERRVRRKAATKEMINVYGYWLFDEVAYIITDQERAAFKKLGTDEEREQFIEQFWERRNPEPVSPENKFKKEYYRRIVLANQRFSRDVPGWKTDRGRIYILYGPPDETDTYSTRGGTVGQSGDTASSASNYPIEEWCYHSILGLGSNISVKFADPANSGQFSRVLDPGEEDPLKATLPEILRNMIQEQVDRILKSLGKDNTARVGPYVRATNPPGVQFRDMRAVLTSKLAPPQAVPVSLRTYSVAATEETDFNLFTIQVPNRRLRFQRQGDVMHAGLEICGQLVTFSGRIAQVFEKGLEVNVPEKDFPEWNDRNLVYQEAVPARPGIYKLSVVVKDTQSGQMGYAAQEVRLPRLNPEMLGTSSLILADELGWPENDGGASDPFLVGGNRIVPNNDRVFSRDKGLGMYLEIYGLGIDPATHKTSAAIEFLILREGKTVLDQTQEIHDSSVEHVVQSMLHLNESLPPGDYQLELEITDRVRNQTISPSTTFKLM